MPDGSDGIYGVASCAAQTRAQEGIASSRWVPFDEVLAMMASGQLRDGETMAAPALAGVRLGRFR